MEENPLHPAARPVRPEKHNHTEGEYDHIEPEGDFDLGGLAYAFPESQDKPDYQDAEGEKC